jgi:hypothetical protein
VALAKARCKWGDGPNDVTVPTLIEPMRVRCSSYLHSTEAVRSLRLSLNEEDFADTGPFTFYKEPRLAVFVTALQPEGGVSEGGTLVTVRGAGFDVMSAGIALAHVRCRWGSIHAVGNDTAALSVSSTEIVCPSSPGTKKGIRAVPISQVLPELVPKPLGRCRGGAMEVIAIAPSCRRSWWPRTANPGHGWCRWTRNQPRRKPGPPRGQLLLPAIDVRLAPLHPEELDATGAPLAS